MSEENYKKIFSKNLSHYIKERDIKQIDLAKYFNIAKSTVSSWCTGEKMPRMDKIEMLADFFGVNKSDLLEEKHADNSAPEENVVVYCRNGKTTEIKLSKEKMDMITKMIDAIKDDEDNSYL